MSPREADRTLNLPNVLIVKINTTSLVSIVLYEIWSFFRQEIFAGSLSIVTNL